MKAQGKNVAHYFLTHAQNAPLVAIPTGLPHPRQARFSEDGQHFWVQSKDSAWSEITVVGDKVGHLDLDELVRDSVDIVFAPDQGAVAMRDASGAVFVQAQDASLKIKQPQQVNLYGGRATSLCFQNLGAKLCVGLTDGKVLTYDVPQLLMQVPSTPTLIYHHDGPTIALGCSTDGAVTMTASNSGRVVLIPSEQASAPPRAVPLHQKPVVAHAFSPGGAYLATADATGRVLISHILREPHKSWSRTGITSEHFITVVEVPGIKGTITSLTFSPKGTRLCVVYEGVGLAVYHLEEDQADGPIKGEPQTFAHSFRPTVLFSDDDNFLIALGEKISVMFRTENIRQDAYVLLPSAVKAACPIPNSKCVALGLDLGEWWPTTHENLYSMCKQAVNDAATEAEKAEPAQVNTPDPKKIL